MLKRYRTDLHLHTCLSPCADNGMDPKRVVETARKRGADVIAICDHNSMENTDAAIRVGNRVGVVVLPGMEICSKEEAHLLAIFEKPDAALAMQEYVYAHLPKENRSEYFGGQMLADENGVIIGENTRLLIGATDLGVHEIVEKTHALGGLSIASHVDRSTFGIIGQLGFIPVGLPLDGVEISYRISYKEALKKIPDIADFPCVTNSDAHFPADIGRAGTIMLMKTPSFNEIRLALKGSDGRRILWD